MYVQCTCIIMQIRIMMSYTHNTAHVIIILLPLEIIHYTIHLTYNTFNNHLLCEGYALLKCFSCLYCVQCLCSRTFIPPSSLMAWVLKFMCPPAPFQSPSIGLGSRLHTTPKSSATRSIINLYTGQAYNVATPMHRLSFGT